MSAEALSLSIHRRAGYWAIELRRNGWLVESYVGERTARAAIERGFDWLRAAERRLPDEAFQLPANVARK